jgi:thiamine-monophosphate kinase
MSPDARLGLAGQATPAGVLTLVTGGDDYEIVFTAPPEHEAAARQFATRIGEVATGEGLAASWNGAPVPLDRLGWRHR